MADSTTAALCPICRWTQREPPTLGGIRAMRSPKIGVHIIRRNGGTIIPGTKAGAPSRTTRLTRSGSASANHIVQAPPKELPTTSARSMPSASSVAATTEAANWRTGMAS